MAAKVEELKRSGNMTLWKDRKWKTGNILTGRSGHGGMVGKMKRRRMKCRRDDSLTKKKRRNGRYKFTTAFSIFEICGAYLRVTGETITYTRSRIDPSVHFQSKGYSQIGHRVKIHLLLQYMNDFIFPSRLASHCEEKYQQSLLHICPVYSRVGLVECLLFFVSITSSLNVCAYVPIRAC